MAEQTVGAVRECNETLLCSKKWWEWAPERNIGRPRNQDLKWRKLSKEKSLYDRSNTTVRALPKTLTLDKEKKGVCECEKGRTLGVEHGLPRETSLMCCLLLLHYFFLPLSYKGIFLWEEEEGGIETHTHAYVNIHKYMHICEYISYRHMYICGNVGNVKTNKNWKKKSDLTTFCKQINWGYYRNGLFFFYHFAVCQVFSLTTTVWVGSMSSATCFTDEEIEAKSGSLLPKKGELTCATLGKIWGLRFKFQHSHSCPSLSLSLPIHQMVIIIALFPQRIVVMEVLCKLRAVLLWIAAGIRLSTFVEPGPCVIWIIHLCLSPSPLLHSLKEPLLREAGDNLSFSQVSGANSSSQGANDPFSSLVWSQTTGLPLW